MEGGANRKACSRLHGQQRLPIFGVMKPIVALVLFLLAGRLISTLTADPLSDVAALNAQRDSEERYKRLAADVQSVLETQEVLIKRQDEFRQQLDKLVDKLRTLKEDHTRAAGSVASR